MEFVDDLRFLNLDELHIGPQIGDMVALCLQVKNWPDDKIRRRPSNCFVCVWGFCCQTACGILGFS